MIDIATICAAIRQTEQVLDQAPAFVNPGVRAHRQLLANQVLILQALALLLNHDRGHDFTIDSPHTPSDPQQLPTIVVSNDNSPPAKK